jgi:quaternary ammonium compound-resistance protein SugE
MALHGLAVRTLPVDTAYAVWTGIGTLGTALLGIFLFGESTDPHRLAFTALIVAGVVGLTLVTPRGRIASPPATHACGPSAPE